MVDTNGTAVILKNNTPKYVLVDYETLIKEEKVTPTVVEQSTLDEVVTSVLSQHLNAFKELEKSRWGSYLKMEYWLEFEVSNLIFLSEVV